MYQVSILTAKPAIQLAIQLFFAVAKRKHCGLLNYKQDNETLPGNGCTINIEIPLADTNGIKKMLRRYTE